MSVQWLNSAAPAGSNRTKRVKFNHLKVWAGDHTACRHSSGECSAIRGWVLNADGGVTPRSAHVPTEDHASAIVDVPGRGSMDLWKAKGNVPFSEADGVKPTPELHRNMVERGAAAYQKSMAMAGEKAKDVRELTAEWRQKHEAQIPAPKKAKK